MTETCECGCVGLALTLLSFLFCTSLPTSRSASAKRAVRIDWLAPGEGVAKGFLKKRPAIPDMFSLMLHLRYSAFVLVSCASTKHTLFIQPVVPNIPINHCAVVMLSLINSFYLSLRFVANPEFGLHQKMKKIHHKHVSECKTT